MYSKFTVELSVNSSLEVVFDNLDFITNNFLVIEKYLNNKSVPKSLSSDKTKNNINFFEHFFLLFFAKSKLLVYLSI